jgi:hypothetical protein
VNRRILHLHNGDAARAVLERSDLPGAHAVWSEVLHEGPVRGLETRSVWRAERARYYASLVPLPPDRPDAEALLRRWDAGLESAAAFDEVLLWFEHDLFDQLCLIHHLQHFARAEARPTTLSLVCIGAHPQHPRFLGLGQLSPSAMAALFETRKPITEAQTALASRTWRAFCGPDPTPLAAILDTDTGALTFLDPALRRFLSEYPSPQQGLSRTEGQILDALAEGVVTGADLFRANQQREESPFMGDLVFWSVLRRLADGPHPLVIIAEEGEEPISEREVALSESGARVRSGRADAIALNGIDLWRGGVHLRGREGIWRWDAETRVLARR